MFSGNLIRMLAFNYPLARRILLFGFLAANVFLSLPVLANNNDGTAETEKYKIEYKPLQFGGSEEFGSASKLLVNPGQTFFSKNEWLDHLGAYVIQSVTVDDKIDVNIGLRGVFQFPKQELAQEQFGGSQYKLFFVGPAIARVDYKFGNTEHPVFTLGGGMFPFKYNTDAVNLGEYLFRSTPYPTTLMTGGLNNVNDNSANVQGLIATYTKNQFSADFLLTTQTSLPPLYDGSLAGIAHYTSESGFLSLGAGVNFQRLFEVRPSHTQKKAASNSYFTKNGKDYTGNLQYYDNAAGFYTAHGDPVLAKEWKDQSDSVKIWRDSTGFVPGAEFYTTAGTVVVGFGSLNLGTLFSSELIGEKDLRLYFEAALLGVKNYPVFYENRLQRIPVMVGLNIPTFKWLDLLAVQGEYFLNRFMNSTYSLGQSNTAVPYFPSGNEALYSQDTYMDITKKDDYSYTILAQKTILDCFTISGQLARDHLRTIGTNWFYGSRYEPAEVLRTSRDWYWMLQFAWKI